MLSSQSIVGDKTWMSAQIKSTSTPKKKVRVAVGHQAVKRMFKTSTMKDMHSESASAALKFSSGSYELSRVASSAGTSCISCSCSCSSHGFVTESTRIRRPRPIPICCSSFAPEFSNYKYVTIKPDCDNHSTRTRFSSHQNGCVIKKRCIQKSKRIQKLIQRYFPVPIQSDFNQHAKIDDSTVLKIYFL